MSICDCLISSRVNRHEGKEVCIGGQRKVLDSKLAIAPYRSGNRVRSADTIWKLSSNPDGLVVQTSTPSKMVARRMYAFLGPLKLDGGRIGLARVIQRKSDICHGRVAGQIRGAEGNNI